MKKYRVSELAGNEILAKSVYLENGQLLLEKGISLEDMFIMYMDLQTEAACASEKKLRENLQDLNTGDGMPLLFR